MIGVSASPCSSSAARSAPTRPSIMSLGATTSAPASACETAVRASSSSVRSLSTTPSSRRTPQWPCVVYSHRQRSQITSRSGCAALIARVASWTIPSSSQAPEPSSSLAAGRPNSSTAGMPSAAASPASSTAAPIERWSMPGMLAIGDSPVDAVAHEHRVHEVATRTARSPAPGRAAGRSCAGGACGWRGTRLQLRARGAAESTTRSGAARARASAVKPTRRARRGAAAAPAGRRR